MKKYFQPYFFFVLLFFLQITACHKESATSIPKINMVLWNKPLSTIREHVQGDWTFVKFRNGFSGAFENVNNGELYVSGDTVRWWMESRTLEADTIITWIRAKSIYFLDSTYTMYFPSLVGNGYMTNWTVNEVKDDTLITKDDTFDGSFYYFIKK